MPDLLNVNPAAFNHCDANVAAIYGDTLAATVRLVNAMGGGACGNQLAARAAVRNTLREVIQSLQMYVDESFNADNPKSFAPQPAESPVWRLSTSNGEYVTGFSNTLAMPTYGRKDAARTFNSKADAEHYAARYCISVDVRPIASYEG